MPANRTRLAGLCAAALVFGAFTITHTAPALGQGKKAAAKEESPTDKAKRLYGEAQAKFKEGDFAGALPLFQQADESVPGAAPKHKVALCYDKLGKGPEAVAAYKDFLASNPSEKYADRAEAAKKRIAELEAAMPATVMVKITPEGVEGVQIAVDGNPAPGPELSLLPGEHTVIVSAEGYQPATETVNVTGGQTLDLAVALMPVAAEPATPPPAPPPKGDEEDGGHSNVPAYVTLGIAGAGAILGTVFGIQALSAKSAFDDDPTNENADDAERAALIADMSFGVALTFGITGVVLLFSGGDDEPAEASARPVLAPYAGPTGGGMAATWTF